MLATLTADQTDDKSAVYWVGEEVVTLVVGMAVKKVEINYLFFE